jgi:hypothetical protein
MRSFSEDGKPASDEPRQTSGERRETAISQNFFVGDERTTAFYGKATQEKE